MKKLGTLQNGRARVTQLQVYPKSNIQNEMDETSKHTKTSHLLAVEKNPQSETTKNMWEWLGLDAKKKNVPYNFLTRMSQEDSKWLVSGL